MASKRTRDLTTLILAAGEGTRMKSGLPKVLHAAAGRTLLNWVLDASRQAGARRRVAVLGHQADRVAATLPPDVQTAVQARPLGSGHAVRAARSALNGVRGDILILCGDAPLLRAESLRALVRDHRRSGAVATVLTACVPEPFGYGRIVRDPANPQQVCRIVEEREASPEEKTIDEINSGAYCIDASALWDAVGRIRNRNSKGEYYLTDAVELLARAGEVVRAHRIVDSTEILGVNTRRELAQADGILRWRVLDALMAAGVTVIDPSSTYVEAGVRVGRDTVLLPGTHLIGACVIGPENRLGPYAHLANVRTRRGVCVQFSVVEHSVLGDGVRVGPYSHLRPGTRVASGVCIGNFAEINRSRIRAGAKIGHVSYLGDARIGRKVNIGAGTITANYDGARKHATRIEDRAFIGSGTVIIAPNRVGAGALTGAGAVLKADTNVPAGRMAVGVPARILKRAHTLPQTRKEDGR